MHLIEMLIERDHQSSNATQLQSTWFVQAEEMAHCLRIHRQSYGTKHIPSHLTDAVQAALRILVHHIDEKQQIFIEICRFGIALGQKFKPTAETIQTIQSLANRGSVKLPREAIAILDGTELWKTQIAAN